MEPYGFTLLERYPDWWHVFFGTALASTLLTGAFFVLARRFQLLPSIRARDVHTERKPRVGGVAMWLVIVGALVLIATSPDLFGNLQFGDQTLWGLDRALWGVLFGLGILLLFGIWDDIKGLTPAQQLIGQILAASAVVWGGVQVEYVRLPGFGELWLNGSGFFLPDWLGGGVVWYWSALFSYLWVIAMINVMNFFDGLDGLAGSVATTGAAVLFFVCLRLGLIGPATLALILAGTAFGFLPWNWHPSRLFMGTVGSQSLGFLLGVIAIISGAKVATAVLVLGIPLLDALVVIGRRVRAGVSPFKADQRHLHHRLLTIGLSVPQVVLMVNGVAVIFGLLALRVQNAEGKGWLTVALGILMILFIIGTYLLERRAVKK